MDLPIGGGDLYSTVDDMLKWDQALYTAAGNEPVSTGWVERRTKCATAHHGLAYSF